MLLHKSFRNLAHARPSRQGGREAGTKYQRLGVWRGSESGLPSMLILAGAARCGTAGWRGVSRHAYPPIAR